MSNVTWTVRHIAGFSIHFKAIISVSDDVPLQRSVKDQLLDFACKRMVPNLTEFEHLLLQCNLLSIGDLEAKQLAEIELELRCFAKMEIVLC